MSSAGLSFSVVRCSISQPLCRAKVHVLLVGSSLVIQTYCDAAHDALMLAVLAQRTEHSLAEELHGKVA